MTTFPITPAYSQQIDATDTSGRVALGGVGKTLLVQNAGTAVVFVKVGDITVTASVTMPTLSYPVLGGAVMSWTVPDTFTHVAAICLSGQTTTIFVTRGEGS